MSNWRRLNTDLEAMLVNLDTLTTIEEHDGGCRIFFLGDGVQQHLDVLEPFETLAAMCDAKGRPYCDD